MKVLKFKHVYENQELYRLGFGHGMAHVARETTAMLQMMDRHVRPEVPYVNVLELGSGPNSKYKALFESFAEHQFKGDIMSYTGTDFVAGTPGVLHWDFNKPYTGTHQWEVVLMPYFLSHSIVNGTNWGPMTAAARKQFELSLARIVARDGVLIVHEPMWHETPSEWETEEWVDEGFVEYSLLRGLGKLFGVDINTQVPTFYKSRRSTYREGKYNVDRVLYIEVYATQKDGEMVTLRAEFSKSCLYYERQRLTTISENSFVPEGRYLEDEHPQAEEIAVAVGPGHKRKIQYWTVYRRR